MLFLTGVVVMLSLPACNGILGYIYDEPLAVQDVQFGFISKDDNTNTGRIYIDATDYTEWHYIDLHNKTVVTTDVAAEAPQNWDFAVHRYDTKTNAGAVAESDAEDFSSIRNVNSIPEDAFVVDEWTTDKITIDMSQMMNGEILYAEDYYNPCLSKWLNVDTSTMPPIYSLSGKIYILKMSDGTYAALRLVNFMNDAATKGFMTIDYLFPVMI